MKNTDQEVSSQCTGKTKILRYVLVMIVLFLMILSGIVGYLIGVKRGKITTNRFASQLTICRASQTTISYATGTPYPTPTHDPVMANWQSYTNNKYGFSFKYPTQWILDPEGFNPPNSPLSLIVKGGNPKMDSIRVSMTIHTIPNSGMNWTPEQWFKYIIAENNAPELKYSYISIDGYPAIRNTQTIAYEEYEIIAPVKNLTTQNAEYMINFSNVGEMQSNPYPVTDPFLQQAYMDFHRMLSSFRIMK